MSRRWRRWLWIALAVVLGVLLTLAVGVRLAARQLQSQVLSALGPRATVGAVEIGWTGIELRDLRVAAMAAPRWPLREELRAARVHVRPDLRNLWARAIGGPWRTSQVTVEDGYLSMLRARGGRLRMLPAAYDTPAPGRASGRTAATSTRSACVVIGQVRLHGVAIDFHDASVRTAVPHRIRIEQIDATIGPLRLPNLDADLDLGPRGR